MRWWRRWWLRDFEGQGLVVVVLIVLVASALAGIGFTLGAMLARWALAWLL